MKKLLLIVNPCAGQKKAKKYLSDIIDIFNRAGYTVITHITACTGDAEAACIQYADQVSLVVCCGGDGTFNETVSGVLKSNRPLPIGYIPAGSTNDFAASLGLSTNLLQAARDITESTPKQLDIGSFAGRYFSYVASFGAFTRTSFTTPQNMKNILGHAAYMLSGIQELSQLRPHRLRFALPDGRVIEDNFLFGAISNTTSLGGILSLSSSLVDMADGMFELLLVRAPKDLFELRDCVKALQQQTYNCSMLTFLNTPRVRITAPADLPWTLDGEEEPGRSNAEVVCLKHAIRVCHKSR